MKSKTEVFEEKLDAESACRRKQVTAQQHLEHLLRIGHAPSSTIIKAFKQMHYAELNG